MGTGRATRRKGQGTGAGDKARKEQGTGAWDTAREGQGGVGRGAEGTAHRGGAGRTHAGRNMAWGWETDAWYECDVGAVHAHGAHVVVPP